jgi:hypothetical protein
MPFDKKSLETSVICLQSLTKEISFDCKPSKANVMFLIPFETNALLTKNLLNKCNLIGRPLKQMSADKKLFETNVAC